jgi:hypothetical protein
MSVNCLVWSVWLDPWRNNNRRQYSTHPYITAVIHTWSKGGALILIVTVQGGEEGQTLVPLLTAAFYNTKFWR